MDNAHKTDAVRSKGLSSGSVGMVSAAIIGISCVAPAYTLSGALGPTASEVGKHLPAIFLVGFVPMLLVAIGYRELNMSMPDSGTTFTWATRAFGPVIGWLGGWGLLAATILVLSNLAGIAVTFFYILLSEIFRKPEIASWADNALVNVLTCLVFMVVAATISYRGMEATKSVQYVLVAFQLGVLVLFSCMALYKAYAHGGVEAFDPTPFSWEWFNPFGVGSFSAFAAGIALSVFIYWGWDVVLTMTEETKGSHNTPGKAATLTIFLVVSLYQLISIGVISYSGISDGELGLANPAIHENIFAVLAGPVMGPLAILMALAVLGSSAASLQSTFISPARTMLAMGFYGALPPRFAKIDPKFQSPSTATIASAVVAFIFYAVMRMISEAVLWDTITALGMMVCFYYAITAFACVWYLRKQAVESVRNMLMKCILPGIGGVLLMIFFFQTSYDAMDPSYGSGSEIFGLGLVFVLGAVVLISGVFVMLLTWWKNPEFFRSRGTLKRGLPGEETPLTTVDQAFDLQ